MTKLEEKIWREDSNQYVAGEEDEYDMSNIKNLVLQILNNMVEQFPNMVQNLMTLIDNLLFGSQEEEMKNLFAKLLKSGKKYF